MSSELAPQQDDDARRVLHALSVRAWGADGALELIGRDARFLEAIERARRLAFSDRPILIEGETGTGKELFARAIFLFSPRHDKTFISVNCAQYINDQMMASDLFGHVKGSFTGAVADRAGIFAEADGGVLFLDEIGELPAAGQAMLLRVLENGEIQPVGGRRPRHVCVRVIAATNCHLGRLVSEGRFRSDLYFRLRQLRLQTPTLRERRQDIALIAQWYLAKLNARTRQPKSLATNVLSWLDEYDWPGNIRELRGCIESGFFMSSDREIGLSHVREALEDDSMTAAAGLSFVPPAHALEWNRLVSGETEFWADVHAPFMARDFSREQVRSLIATGYKHANQNYKKMLALIGLPDKDYLKFMDFLRHHELKPLRERD